MRRSFLFFVLAILLGTAFPPRAAHAQFVSQVRLDSPKAGDAVQGIVAVLGNTDVRGFLSYELAFSFEEDAALTWFVIVESEEPIEDGTLGEWDTTTLTDGTYSLRLTVHLEGEDPVVILVEGIRVRNYSSIETNTPAPTSTPAPGLTATPTVTSPLPTPTDLPSNPAEIDPADVRGALLGGIGAAILLFALLAGYARSRSR